MKRSYRFFAGALGVGVATILISGIIEPYFPLLSLGSFIGGGVLVVLLFFVGAIILSQEIAKAGHRRLMIEGKPVMEYRLAGIGTSTSGAIKVTGRIGSWPSSSTLRVSDEGLSLSIPSETLIWKYTDILRVRAESTHPPRWPALQLWIQDKNAASKEQSIILLFRGRKERGDVLEYLESRGVAIVNS